MTNESNIPQYLAQGGKLSAPDNAPPRYRAELLRIMASFVDSELAGAAGFADVINDGPGIKQRITASRIVLEKMDHAERVLNLMGDFGANTQRYMNIHPWAARVERDAALGVERAINDMRLNVFSYPLEGWADAVVMNVLMGRATIIQLSELSQCSYQPLAEVLSEILPREKKHAVLGEEGLEQLAAAGSDSLPEIKKSVEYWRPKVEASFGGIGSNRFELLRSFGLRHRQNEEMLGEWRVGLDEYTRQLGL